MPLFQIDSRFYSHPATLRLTNSDRGAWLQAGCWLATFPKQHGFIPRHMTSRFGNARNTRNLVAAGLWVEWSHADQGVGYIARDTMDFAGSRLRDPMWSIGRTDVRGYISPRLRRAVHDRDGWICVDCGDTEDLTLDHIHPWSKGGDDTFDNLRTLCRSCNSRKGARV